MKKEEIEHLLADYASGEISANDKARLEEMFAKDPALKQEADEMEEVWQAINQPNHQPGKDMDNGFYAMLQNEKEQQKGARVVKINLTWLKTAAAVAACLAAFVIGRYTVSPEKITEYKVKTVFVKQPAIAQAIKTEDTRPVFVSRPVENKTALAPKNSEPEEHLTLAPQLRSVFASERMAAVAKLAAKADVTQNDLKMLEMVLNEDPSANVRLMVVNALQPMFAKNDVQQLFINTLGKQDDPLIQSTIVDILVEARSKQAVPQMLVLLDDKNTAPSTQTKIKTGIESFLN